MWGPASCRRHAVKVAALRTAHLPRPPNVTVFWHVFLFVGCQLLLGRCSDESSAYLAVFCCMRDPVGKKRHCKLRLGNSRPLVLLKQARLFSNSGFYWGSRRAAFIHLHRFTRCLFLAPTQRNTTGEKAEMDPQRSHYVAKVPLLMPKNGNTGCRR